MKRIVVVLLLLTALFNSVLGQNEDVLAEIIWSDPLEDETVKIIQSDTDYVYYTTGIHWVKSKKHIIVGRLNAKTLQEELREDIPLAELNGDDPYPVGYKVRNGEVFGYFTIYDKKQDQHVLLVRRLLGEQGVAKDYKVVTKINSDYETEGSFKGKWSENDSLLLVLIDPPLEKKYSEEKVIAAVFNANDELKYEAEIELQFADKYFEIQDFEVTNGGNVMVLGYKTPEKKKGEKKEYGESNRTYFLYVYDKVSEKLLEYNLGLEDKFVNTINLLVDLGNNKASIHGLYGESNLNWVGGSFGISIDQSSLEVSNAIFIPFEKDLLRQTAPGNKYQIKKIEKGKVTEIGVVEFVLRNKILKKDGGYMLVYENELVRTTPQSAGTLVYSTDEMLIHNYNAQGELIWNAVLPKSQTELGNGHFLGYMLLVNKDRVHFLFNDHKKNEVMWGDEAKLVNEMIYPKKAVLAMASLSDDGSWERNVLTESKVDDFIIAPRYSRMSGKNSNAAILLSYDGKSTRIGRIELF